MFLAVGILLAPVHQVSALESCEKYGNIENPGTRKTEGSPENPIYHKCYVMKNGEKIIIEFLDVGSYVEGFYDSGTNKCRVITNAIGFPNNDFGRSQRELFEKKKKVARKWCDTRDSQSGTDQSSTSSNSNSSSNSSSGSNSSSSSSSNTNSSSPFNSLGTADTSFAGSCRSFLGLTSWDCNVNISDQESLKRGIWMIAANVLTDITVIAAYLVLGYVIYGGYQYTFSAGDPNKVAAGKKTLTHAFIGLAIVMSASAILSSIRIALVGSGGNIGNCLSDQGCVDPGDMVVNLIQWVVGVAGVVSAVFVVYGGITYTTSAGDPNKLQKAKNMILYALIGLVIVALAEIITAFVSNMIREANKNALINETVISKEVHEIKTN